MTYIIRLMQPDDLDAVTQIDQISFSSPWPQNAFEYELLENRNAVCWVVEEVFPTHPNEIIGALIVWLVVDEAQIATFAIHPDARRKGVGEALLDVSLNDAQQKGAAKAILEVRAGNSAAINLYKKFGFKVVGRRKRYYQDNHEDAVLMTLFDLSGINNSVFNQDNSEFDVQESTGNSGISQ